MKKRNYMLVPSGQSYCFECIFQYLSTNPNKDPITNEYYQQIDLIQNYTLKSMIEKLSHAIPAEIEDNNNIIVHASVVEESSNIRLCNLVKIVKDVDVGLKHPEGQSSVLTIV